MGKWTSVLSDILMPDLDGIELLRTLREREQDVPVLLMTGGPAVETAIQAVELGALRYLVKPIAAAGLRDAVEAAIRVHRLTRWEARGGQLSGLRQHAHRRSGVSRARVREGRR